MGGRREAASAPEQPQTKHTKADLERLNTVAYSAGAVCWPARHHAIRAICSGRRGTYGTSMLTRHQWWPGKEPSRPRPWRDSDWRWPS